MGVSGEFKYFGPAFSSVERVRPVKAMTLPASLAIGNMTRLRNLEYIAERASGVRRPASASGDDARSLDSARDDSDSVDRSSCFHENSPLSRNTSSLNSFFSRSRRRKPESGA